MPCKKCDSEIYAAFRAILLRCRLVVGQQVLILLTVVRIHAPQPYRLGDLRGIEHSILTGYIPIV